MHQEHEQIRVHRKTRSPENLTLLHLKGNGESCFDAADLCKSLRNKFVLIYYVIERVIARYSVFVGANFQSFI